MINQEKFKEIEFSFSDFYFSNIFNCSDFILENGRFPRPEEMFSKWQKCMEDVLATDEYKDLVVTEEDKLELEKYQNDSYNNLLNGYAGEDPDLYKYIFKYKIFPLNFEECDSDNIKLIKNPIEEKQYLQYLYDKYLVDAPDDIWEYDKETLEPLTDYDKEIAEAWYLIHPEQRPNKHYSYNNYYNKHEEVVRHKIPEDIGTTNRIDKILKLKNNNMENKDKKYVVVERTYEYDDNYYYESGGYEIKQNKFYSTKEEAQLIADELNSNVINEYGRYFMTEPSCYDESVLIQPYLVIEITN